MFNRTYAEPGFIPPIIANLFKIREGWSRLVDKKIFLRKSSLKKFVKSV
jgi:hypothetical protein